MTVLQSRSHSEWLDTFLTEEVHPAHHSTSRGSLTATDTIEERVDPVRLRREAGEPLESTGPLHTAPPYKVTLVVASDGRLGVEVGSYQHLDKEPTFDSGHYPTMITGLEGSPGRTRTAPPAPEDPSPTPAPSPDPTPDDGIDDRTGLAEGVVKDETSPTGLSYDGIPVNRDGSPA